MELERALWVADRANNAAIQQGDGRWTVQGDPTEGALLVAARKAGLDPAALDERLPRVGEVPCSSERKLMSTLHRDTEQHGWGIVFTKGAPDVLLARCSRELVGDERRPLTEERRKEILETNEALAGQAPSPELFAEAGRLAAAASSPVSDVRGSEAYKRHMVEVYVRRGLTRAAEMAGAA